MKQKSSVPLEIMIGWRALLRHIFVVQNQMFLSWPNTLKIQKSRKEIWLNKNIKIKKSIGSN